ncbi:MAG: hypothetical protein NTU47_04305 [Ignavibacteriales bacterium]|nr:hypothetical protein [Ignavibacteriales bacterium]
MPEVMTWEDVGPVAQNALNVWVGGAEQRWAERAWVAILDAGLAEYSTELERHKVGLRFISLCDIYLDFCKVGREEECESDYSAWIADLGFSDFILGVLIGRSKDIDDNDIEDYASDDLIRVLASSVREEVVTAITKGLGGRNGLFESLWLSRFDEKETVDEERDSVFTELTGDKMALWSWIDQGCYPYR